MNATIENIDALLSEIMEEYPSLPSTAGRMVASEINALQRHYFSEVALETGQLFMPLPQETSIDLDALTDVSPAIRNEDILSVYWGREHTPIVPLVDFFEERIPCCTFIGRNLCFLNVDKDAEDVMILYRRMPPDISYTNGQFTGSVYLPEKHLPMILLKARHTFSMLSGDYAMAEVYAEACNSFSDHIIAAEKKAQYRRKTV